MDNLQIRDFLNYRFISKLQYAPDGAHAAFVVSRMDWEENKYSNNLFLLDTRTEEIRQLTYAGDVKDFLWLDGRELLFPALRSDADKERVKKGEKLTVFHKLNIDGGEAGEFLRLPYSVSELKVISDDCYALVCEWRPDDADFSELDEAARNRQYRVLAEEKDYEILDEIPFWHNGGGFSNKMRNRLFLCRAGRVTPVTDPATNVDSLRVKDGKLVFTGNSFTDKMGLKDALHCYDAAADKLETVVETGTYAINMADFFADGFVMAASLCDKYGNNQNTNFYTVKDGQVELLCETDESPGSYTNSDTRLYGGTGVKVYNDEIYYTAVDHLENVLRKVTREGKLETLLSMPDTIDAFDVCADGLLYYGLNDLTLHEVFKLENGRGRQLSGVNNTALKGKKLSRPERLDAQGEAGTVEGFVIRPVDFDPAQKYPAVLSIHGGPKTAFGNTFFHEMQVTANRGYFVLLCNPTGGEGRGNEFADIRGRYGSVDYNDLMAFTDAALAAYPQIDQGRLAVTGGSYGGYMTNWIIGHTDRFCCAVSQRSISNWISKFNTTDIGYFFNADQVAATPWKDHDKMWANSPLKYADQVKTPTLFLHSDEDYRCWIGEGLQMFTALKYHGVPARMCLFHGENHELSRSGKPKHRARRLEEMLDWFDKYCK